MMHISTLWHVFLAVLLISGCEKKDELPAQVQPEAAAVQQLIDGPGPVSAEASGNAAPETGGTVQNVTAAPVTILAVSPAIQELIESYDPPFMRGLKAALAFQIEGNFTGSGNREIIGFYEGAGDRSGYGAISGFACFVFDSGGEEIESVYDTAFLTWEMPNEKEAKTGLSEALGSPIFYRGRKIGCYGDFNRNGKDELCVFGSTIYFRPYFFEFDGLGFEETIQLVEWPEEIIIIDINPEERIITLQRTRIYDDPPADFPPDANKTVDISSYIWDEATQRYEKMPDEIIKHYRWNRTTREYEEIEG